MSAPHRAGAAAIAADMEGIPASAGFAIVLTDFFSVDTVFLKRLYVLSYMELAWPICIRPVASDLIYARCARA